jgi:hypothetical protein
MVSTKNINMQGNKTNIHLLAVFRANTRNAVELEKFLRKKGAAALKARGQQAPAIDPSDPDEYDRLMREEHGPPPGYTTSAPTRQGTQRQAGNGTGPTHPEPARLPEKRQGGSGWFGFGGKKKQHDVEQGELRRNEALPPTPADIPTRSKSTLQKNRPV